MRFPKFLGDRGSVTLGHHNSSKLASLGAKFAGLGSMLAGFGAKLAGLEDKLAGLGAKLHGTTTCELVHRGFLLRRQVGPT